MIKPFTLNGVKFIDTEYYQALDVERQLKAADKIFNCVWLSMPTACKQCSLSQGLTCANTFFFTVMEKDFENLLPNEHGIICIVHGIISDKKK